MMAIKVGRVRLMEPIEEEAMGLGRELKVLQIMDNSGEYGIPLHVAVFSENSEVVHLVVVAGADPEFAG